MSTFNRKRAIAAFIGALALLSGCGSGQSTSTGTNTFSYPGYPGTGGVGGGSAVGCVPLNNPHQSVSVGFQASGVVSPLIQCDMYNGCPQPIVSYGVDYRQVTMTSHQGITFRFYSAKFGPQGDGLYLRLPDNVFTQYNTPQINVAGDVGAVTLGPQILGQIFLMAGPNACLAGIQSIRSFGTEGNQIILPEVILNVRGPAGIVPVTMKGF